MLQSLEDEQNSERYNFRAVLSISPIKYLGNLILLSFIAVQ